MHKSLFRFIEGCLYGYQENMALLEYKCSKLEMIASSGQSSLVVGDRVMKSPDYDDAIVNKITTMNLLREEIVKLKYKTEPITAVLKYLNDDNAMRKILELRYFEKKSWSQVADELHMSMRHVFNKRRELVKLVGKFFYSRDEMEVAVRSAS
jgi:DNA-directed RNA polymerase specialized sigma subunit